MIKNPDEPLRTAYLAALAPVQPIWVEQVPKNVTVPLSYTLIGSQTKNPTEKGKEGCMEWLCTIVIDVYSISPAGYSAKSVNDTAEEQIIDIIEQGFAVDGFMVKSIDFVDSITFKTLQTPTQNIERRSITYQHWLAQL